MKEYANYNQYGYRNITIVVDDEKKTFILYHGCTAPISKPRKTTKKFIYELAATLEAAGYTKQER